MPPENTSKTAPKRPDPASVAVGAPLQFGFLPGALDYQSVRFYVGSPPHARLRQLIRRGEFPAGIKLGPKWLVWLKADLDAYLQGRVTDPESLQHVPSHRSSTREAEVA